MATANGCRRAWTRYLLDRFGLAAREGRKLIEGPVNLHVTAGSVSATIIASTKTTFDDLMSCILSALFESWDDTHLWHFFLPWDARFTPRPWRGHHVNAVAVLCPFEWARVDEDYDEPTRVTPVAPTTPIGAMLLEGDQIYLRFDYGDCLQFPIGIGPATVDLVSEPHVVAHSGKRHPYCCGG